MKSLICTGGIALAFALASITGAEAQKKMSYEQAFAKCKQEMGGGGLGSEALNTAGRYAAAGGCMQKYGIRLKMKGGGAYASAYAYDRGAYAYDRGAYADGRGAYPYGRDPYAYSRTNPYAPGVNWPKAN